jgi:hypothetical protein
MQLLPGMRQSILLSAALVLFSGLAFAEDWTGRLLDASCYDQNKTAKPCDATSSTTSFVLDVNGKIYKLDAAGNSKAVDAIKSRADRSAGGGAQPSGPVNAKVTGSMEGTDNIKVEKVEVQ